MKYIDKDINNYRQLVRLILTADKRSRSSDRRLYIQVIEHCDVDLNEDEKAELVALIKRAKLPSFRTIERERRRIQEKGELKADDLTLKRRRELEQEYREEYKN